ncbi:MAG: hypothetical protein ACFCVK_10050 [Acidimicrobiales bacterium]
MRYTRLILGAFGGAVVGGAVALLLVVAALFTAVQAEAGRSITGLVDVSYVSGPDGGFDLAVSTGAGTLVCVVVGAALGALVVLTRSMIGGRDGAEASC